MIALVIRTLFCEKTLSSFSSSQSIVLHFPVSPIIHIPNNKNINIASDREEPFRIPKLSAIIIPSSMLLIKIARQ